MQEPPQEYQIYDPELHEIRVLVVQPPRKRYWLHAVLFLLTVLSTLCIGARLQYNFLNNLPPFDLGDYNLPWSWALADWRRLALGIPFSACLLGILTAHELGHYILCVRRKVFATLPFFIPAPTLIGTFGAFIRIQSPIRSRRDLFDIGIAGPIAGFVVAVPVMICSLLLSKPLTLAPDKDAIQLGFPLIFHAAQWCFQVLGIQAPAAHLSLDQLYLHPTAIAAWIGMLATALNLLPGGQLDGGHIVFALKPRAHRVVSVITITVLLVLSWFFWTGWLVWAIILRFTGSRHPQVPLSPALAPSRRVLGVVALVMLVLSMALAPVRSSLPETIQQIRKSLSETRSDTSSQK